MTFHGLFCKALRCRILVPAEYWCPYGTQCRQSSVGHFNDHKRSVLSGLGWSQVGSEVLGLETFGVCLCVLMFHPLNGFCYEGKLKLVN